MNTGYCDDNICHSKSYFYHSMLVVVKIIAMNFVETGSSKWIYYEIKTIFHTISLFNVTTLNFITRNRDTVIKINITIFK